MPKMDLKRTNEEFALAAADIIDVNGLAKMQYHDKRQGCYCTLGAFRILIFGFTDTENTLSHMPKRKRYLELVDWFADKVRTPIPNDQRNSEAVIAMWNDGSSKKEVVTKLREVGKA